jgi:predicted nucleic acid-binding protein
MAEVVVDTCVVSFLFKRNDRAQLYRPHLAGNTLIISFMTLAELYRWPLERGWGENRRAALQEHLNDFVVYPFNQALCQTWAEITHHAASKGKPIPMDDAWTAATALLNDIPLVSNNRRHFKEIEGLKLLSESPDT